MTRQKASALVLYAAGALALALAGAGLAGAVNRSASEDAAALAPAQSGAAGPRAQPAREKQKATGLSATADERSGRAEGLASPGAPPRSDTRGTEVPEVPQPAGALVGPPPATRENSPIPHSDRGSPPVPGTASAQGFRSIDPGGQPQAREQQFFDLG